ncbi:integrase catalytic domain-containing protein [Trichonephila clavipes]|nr:integrase catalytic domain-containing protein [Trichonephila clavipes]
MKWMDDINMDKITKRSMLSTVHKVFDPFGFTSPVMLCPKIILQKAWKLGTSWDEELTGELRKEFVLWFQELKYLSDMQIPRLEKNDRFEVFLLAAKSRVAHLRSTTISRKELLAAVIGARLTNSVVEVLGWRNVTTYYWSDSTTELAWILREENWSVFISNRVQEIKKLCNPTSWRHIPGDRNLADLTYRGCKAKRFVYSRWWEGSQWMKSDFEFQKIMASSQHDWNEEEIEKEMSKTSYVLTNNEADVVENWC